MPRIPLAGLDGREFDALVVGAGVNGASAAQHLAAAGYSVLLADKGDFGAGSSSRSGRLLHCGLRYLEPGEGLAYMTPRGSPLWHYARHPGAFLAGCAKAREAMHCRAQLVRTMPERVRAKTFHYPIWADSKFSPWQAALGFRLLRALGPADVPLEARRIGPDEARRMPLLAWLRDADRLRAVFAFREYRFEWPERIVVDTVLDAERMGAVARNYTAVTGLARTADGRWKAGLAEAAGKAGEATVGARIVVNAAGMWIDKVNRLANAAAGRRISGTKGAHIMVRLPPECALTGLCTYFRDGNPFYVYPWRGLHYIGPTDTRFEGDEDELRATEEEIEFLIAEANHLLPGHPIGRRDVVFTWAGVRPQTYDPGEEMGRRGRRVHDLGGDGMPNVFALTAGNIIGHRRAGAEIAAAVARRIDPSGAAQAIDYGAKTFPDAAASPALLNHWPEARLEQLRHAAAHEHAVTLEDLLFRRVGAGWTETMGREAARTAAEAVADILGWDTARVAAEVAAYHARIARLHHAAAAD